MGARADKAWRAAAACTSLAQAAADDAERDFYVRMRNAWITVGNQSQFIESLDHRDAGAHLAGPARADDAAPGGAAAGVIAEA
jgi:hypothetical protein